MQPKILLAEDNKINQVVAAGVLKKLGYEVDIVEDGRGAVAAHAAAVADRSIDAVGAILMDVMMPNMDGYQATGMIRDFERQLALDPIPIVGLSARAMAGDREIALAAGMTDYLTKPLMTPDLEAVLGRLVVPRMEALAATEPA